MPYTCPECGRTSYHPQDEKYGWCAACNAFTGGGVLCNIYLPSTVDPWAGTFCKLRAGHDGNHSPHYPKETRSDG